MLALIAAMAQQRVIGLNGDMPWHMPEDLKHFKRMTKGKAIIMGRKTFDSIGSKPLPNRRNIVITRQQDLMLDGCDVFNNLQDAIASCDDKDETMIVGGSTLYEQALPIADRLYLTFIDAEVEGDTFFPAWDSDQWVMADRQEHQADADNPYDYQFVTLARVKQEQNVN
ncbi:MAG: type 3 dihydrofolate reductase [Coxiellaceae bacterium]|nr:type 3 dihydrofolate reductase [Coxiellaceae bacterium]